MHKFSTLLIAFAFTLDASASWQPNAEKLIRLPGPMLQKAVEQDLHQSPLGQQLQSSQTRLNALSQELRAAADKVAMSAPEDIDTRHDYLELKSAYLDELESYQAQRRESLSTKQQIFARVAKRLRQSSAGATTPDAMSLPSLQRQAQARISQNTQVVDDLLYPTGIAEKSLYVSQYQANLDKIRELQGAIAKHELNNAATLNGQEVSRLEYVQYLLAETDSSLAILDQEELMLGYMARLVALDAQSLQMQLEYNSPDVDRGQPTAVAEVVDYFVN